MLWTLQTYIFREMGKTFLLTAVGLMVVLGLGGGLMNMIELDQVSAWQMVKLMGFVLPVALALTLPIAALYSAATTYGRLSADNEFVACRSGGINILALLAPTLVISLFSAAVTFVFISSVIPGLIQNLNTMIRSDLEQIVLQGLSRPGGLPMVGDRYRFFADETHGLGPGEDPATSSVQLDGVVFMENDGDQWLRSGSARTMVLSFDAKTSNPSVTADMYDLSLFDHRKNQSAEFREHQRIGPHEIPQRFQARVKWLGLSELAYYRKHPEEWSEVRDRMARVRALASGFRFYNGIAAEFADTGRVELGDDNVSLQLSAKSARRDAKDGRVHFEGDVVVWETTSRGRRAVTGDRAVVVAEAGQGADQAEAYIELFDNVTVADPADPAQTVRKQRIRLDSFQVDPAILEWFSGPQGELRLRDPELFPEGSDAAKRQRLALNARGEVLREIDGVRHSRFAFSVSVFVLVILAAALGIIFRGSHVLTAFGIAFIPTVFVIITIVTGRHLAENPGTTMAGLATLWSGIAVVGSLDVWVLFRVLRR